jgi:hypothetical protein
MLYTAETHNNQCTDFFLNVYILVSIQLLNVSTVNQQTLFPFQLYAIGYTVLTLQHFEE